MAVRQWHVVFSLKDMRQSWGCCSALALGYGPLHCVSVHWMQICKLLQANHESHVTFNNDSAVLVFAHSLHLHMQGGSHMHIQGGSDMHIVSGLNLET